MAKKFNYGKIALVVFITVLIWVGADLALDEILPDKPAEIAVDLTSSPKLWVSLNQSSSVDFRLTLSGPHAAIAEQSRNFKRGQILRFDFDALQEKMDEPGTYTLSLLQFLQKNKELKQAGLKVESCEPDKISVMIEKLVKKTLLVNCIDEEQNPVKTDSVEPKQVEMLVPQDWSGEKLIAWLRLTSREIKQARTEPIQKNPYIELSDGQLRYVPAAVKVTTVAQEDSLSDYTITTARIGITVSPILQGKYKIEVLNLPKVISAIVIRATQDAKHAYDAMPYQVKLVIYDSDKDISSDEPLRRELFTTSLPSSSARIKSR